MSLKILIATPTTDRDALLINDFFDAISQSITRYRSNSLMDTAEFRILILTRKSDYQTIQAWSELAHTGNVQIDVQKVDAYEIEERHNMTAIANKRNIAIEAAKQNNDDFVLFVDSDVMLNLNTIEELVGAAQQGYDVAVAAYEVIWLGFPALGVQKADHFDILDLSDENSNYPQQVHIVGMGCSLISRKCFDIQFIEKSIDNKENLFNWGADSGVQGEDIGFSLNCLAQNKSIYYTGDIVEHRYKDMIL